MTLQETEPPRPGPRSKPNRKPVNVALQGGGAHGAFAWGVLDKILEDGRLDIEAVSATSAGAMNAVVMAYGVSLGGAVGAREMLNQFWTEISRAGELYSPVRTLPWEKWLQAYGFQSEFSPTYHAFQAMTHLFSPYQLNPFNFNPLSDVLLKVVDFEKLSHCNKATRIFLSATNVRTGKIRVFHNEELTVDVVMASACLPYVFQAVEIDGEAYWDGGLHGQSGDLSADLQPGIEGRHHRPHQPDRAQEAAQKRARDLRSHERDQLQLLAHARDARGRVRDAPHR